MNNCYLIIYQRISFHFSVLLNKTKETWEEEGFVFGVGLFYVLQTDNM